MGLGLGRGLAENAQATTPGGHGFGRGPFFVGLKPGVGRASKVTWRALNGHVSTHAPNPSSIIPHGLNGREREKEMGLLKSNVQFIIC